MKKFRVFNRRLLWAGALIIFVLLMMDFNNRLGEMLRLKDEHAQTSVRLTQLVATRQSLQTQIAYATSDVAVQEWARQEGHMALAGDVPIVPIAPAGSTPTPQAAPTAVVQTAANWQVWDALFFGK